MAFAPVGGAASPTSLLTYSGPVSNDPVTISFKQTIGAQRRAAHRDVQQDADVHAVHDAALETTRSGGRHTGDPRERDTIAAR